MSRVMKHIDTSLLLIQKLCIFAIVNYCPINYKLCIMNYELCIMNYEL